MAEPQESNAMEETHNSPLPDDAPVDSFSSGSSPDADFHPELQQIRKPYIAHKELRMEETEEEDVALSESVDIQNDSPQYDDKPAEDSEHEDEHDDGRDIDDSIVQQPLSPTANEQPDLASGDLHDSPNDYVDDEGDDEAEGAVPPAHEEVEALAHFDDSEMQDSADADVIDNDTAAPNGDSPSNDDDVSDPVQHDNVIETVHSPANNGVAAQEQFHEEVVPMDLDEEEHSPLTDTFENESITAGGDDYNPSEEKSVAVEEHATAKATEIDSEQAEGSAIASADVLAPLPSPFSDLGDFGGDMSPTDNAIVGDIMQNDSAPSPLPTEAAAAEDQGQEEEGDGEDVLAFQKAKDSDQPQSGLQDVPKDENESDDEQDVGGLIADIFGESDEEEEFEGFADEELYPKKESGAVQPSTSVATQSDDSDTELRVPSPGQEESDDEIDHEQEPRQAERVVSDFDLMMQKKKELSAGRRRSNKDSELIGDNDDIIAAMINLMKEAAEEDRLLNQNGIAATKKLAMLGTVISHLRKVDLQNTFIDCGILPVLKEWLSPLPDNSLPHVVIREQILKMVVEFPAIDKGALKMSGIGRAIMLLYKHPKESRDNKKIASKIIAEWARPIFGVTTKFTEMSREEREERDKMNVPSNRKRRLSSAGGSNSTDPEKRPRKPGDKGFISRARVPMPSNKDYVVRPVSSMDDIGDFRKNSKKTADRFEKQYRKFKDKKALVSGPNHRAVKMSLNGSKLAL